MRPGARRGAPGPAAFAWSLEHSRRNPQGHKNVAGISRSIIPLHLFKPPRRNVMRPSLQQTRGLASFDRPGRTIGKYCLSVVVSIIGLLAGFLTVQPNVAPADDRPDEGKTGQTRRRTGSESGRSPLTRTA